MSERTKADSAPKRTIFQRLGDVLHADAARHDITDTQFMFEESAACSSADERPPLDFFCANWRGEVAARTVRPIRIHFGSTN